VSADDLAFQAGGFRAGTREEQSRELDGGLVVLIETSALGEMASGLGARTVRPPV